MKFDWIPVTRAQQNCAVLRCEATGRAAVIDPGGDLHLIQDLLEWEELTLELILVTHGHFDHAGGAAKLAAATGARIEGPHRGDAHVIGNMADYAKTRGFTAENYTPSRWLEHGDVVRFGQEELQVLHCPGHCKGHVAYFHAASRQAFVGDILFQGTIGAWEHGDGDLPQLLRSIRTRLFPLGDDVRFLPGHGEPSTFGQERRTNPFVGDAAIEKIHAQRHAQGLAPLDLG
jgi:glyoxylase-like metal-dependent hydrolase (beta-lactamase superfamily II)